MYSSVRISAHQRDEPRRDEEAIMYYSSVLIMLLIMY